MNTTIDAELQMKHPIAKESKAETRLDYLDGLRGIASVFVILCHLAAIFLSSYHTYQPDASALSRFFMNSPLNILTNGSTAVQCFFVLSGFLIARKMYRSQPKVSHALSPVRQYVKLVKLVFPAILFAAVLMWCGLMFHLKAAEQNPNLSFALDYNNFKPSVLNAFLLEPFYRVFVEGSRYVEPFWTIRFEFYGAILITAISYFAKDHVKIAKLTYLFCGFVFALISPHLAAFSIGALAFDCLDRKELDDSYIGKGVRWILSKKVFLILLGIFGAYLACLNQTMTGMWAPIRHLPGFISNHAGIIRALGIGLCLVCICKFVFLQKLLSIKPLKFAGKISPYTYAFHWPVTLSLGCGLYLLLAKTKLPYSVSVLFIGIAVTIATFALAFAYTKLIPLIAALEQWIGRKICSLFKKEKVN